MQHHNADSSTHIPRVLEADLGDLWQARVDRFKEAAAVEQDECAAFAGSAEAASLGSITDIGGTPSDEELTKVVSDYCRRLHARRLAGEILRKTKCQRVTGCGYRMVSRRDGVGLWECPDRERGRISGVCLCGSSWICPVCAPRISAGRVGEVQELAKAAEARGLVLEMESFTIPHTRHDSAYSTIRLIQTCKADVKDRMGKVLREGRVGYVDAGEMTWGANGAHPHIHRMSIVRSGEYDTTAQRDAWLRVLGSYGRRTLGADEHAYNLKTLTTKNAWYISKIGLEIASSALATKDSVTPLGMVYRMVDGTLTRYPWAARFREAAEALASSKFAALRFSRGLRKEFGLVPEKSDAELAKEEETDTDRLLGYLNEDQWLRIRAARLDAALVFVAQKGRDAVNAWLKANDLGHLQGDREELGASNHLRGIDFVEETETLTIKQEKLI